MAAATGGDAAALAAPYLTDSDDELPEYLGDTLGGAKKPPLVDLVERLYASEDAYAEAKEISKGDAARLELPTLDVFTVEHENLLLREPWTTASGHVVRPCVFGNACLGCNPQLPGHVESGGVVLAEAMTPNELRALEASGTYPVQRRSCVLCARFNVSAAYIFARKKRSFPIGCVLNAYTNPVGAGGYNPEDCIPQPGDGGAWLGVMGHVVSLRWNKIRLTQNADTKAWHVDQSRLLFRKGAARTNTFDAIDPTFDPAAVLRRFFRFRTGIVDRDLLFEEAAFLSDNNVRVPTLPETPYLSFTTQIKSFYHKLLVYRINRLNQLCEMANFWGPDVSYTLALYLDAHIPLLHLFKSDVKISSFVLKYPPHQESLPDASWCMLNAALGAHVKNDLSQVFFRALPEQAQTKGLNQLLKKMGQPSLDFVKRITMCSLLGNYRHAVERPRFHIRCETIRLLNDQYLKQYFSQAGPECYFPIYVLREYAGVLSAYVPVFSALMARSIQWNKQNLRINDMMRAIRIGQNTDWSHAFGVAASETLKKHYKRLPKRKLIPRGKCDQTNTLVSVLSRSVNRRSLKRGYGHAFSPAAVMDSLAHPVAKVARLAVDARVRDAGARLLEDLLVKPKKTVGYVVDDAALADDALKELHDTMVGVDAARTTRVVPLPTNVLRAQLDAVKRRFACTSDADPRVRRATRVLVCPCCQEVKNFVLRAAEREGKKTNVRASGWHKLVWDEDARVLRCAKTETCRAYHVATYDVVAPAAGANAALRGGVLVGRFGTAVVSPCCGHLVQASALSSVLVNGEPRFDCPACAAPPQTGAEGEPDPKKCAFCLRDLRGQNAGLALRLYNKEKALFRYPFCKQHFRAWANTAEEPCTFDFVVANMSNRNGAGLVLPS